jgi:hypothetical protein
VCPHSSILQACTCGQKACLNCFFDAAFCGSCDDYVACQEQQDQAVDCSNRPPCSRVICGACQKGAETVECGQARSDSYKTEHKVCRMCTNRKGLPSLLNVMAGNMRWQHCFLFVVEGSSLAVASSPTGTYMYHRVSHVGLTVLAPLQNRSE